MAVMNAYPTRPFPEFEDYGRFAQPAEGGPNLPGPGSSATVRGAGPQGGALRLIARILPTIAVAAWIVMIWVPILDSRDHGSSFGPEVMVTSLGHLPAYGPGLGAREIIAWTLVIGCAIAPWFLRTLTIWSMAVIVSALILSGILIAMLADPPSLIWDGVDGQGRPTGGMIVGEPSFGVIPWLVGCLSLMAAGVCGAIAGWRLRRARRP